MKKTLIKYLCVGLVWSFLIFVAWLGAHFYDLEATFNDDRIILVISFDENRDNDILVLESFEKIKKSLAIPEN